MENEAYQARLSRLREQAEARLGRKSADGAELSPDEAAILIHDYQVHQIELEIQNEELRRALQELEAAKGQLGTARDRYARLFNEAPAGYLVLDDSGVIITANQAFADLIGLGARDFSGMNLAEYILPEDRPLFLSRYRSFFNHPEGKTLEFRMRGVQGVLIVRCVGRVEQDAGDAPGGQKDRRLLLMLNDVSEQVRLENALQQLNLELEERVRLRTRELEESNRQLEAFSYSVSHDLRAPLRGVTGLSRVLLETHAHGLSEEGRQVCALIHESATALDRQIRDLLEYSRTGRREPRVAPVDMTALVHAVVTEQRETGDAARVDFQVADLPPAVAEPALMRQVWANLLANAVKFSSRVAQPVVEVWADREDGAVVYRVRDNGAGFDMRHADKMFGVFKRLHSAGEFEGAGVGLAIVHQIVTRHGGRIQAQGEPGRGATFSFTLGAAEGSASGVGS